jgi:hypothetical protein
MSVPATFFLGTTQALGVDLLNTGAPGYTIVTAANTASAGGFIASAVGKISGTSGGKPVITPDSVISLEWHGEERISDYPVQNGQFMSYNKVAVPFDLRMVMTCQGLNYVQSLLQSVTQSLDQALGQLGLAFGQPMSRDSFLRQLDTMLASTDLYDVVTPDKVYQNVNLVGCNHAKKSEEGGTLIIAELMFKEVRETGSAQYSTLTVTYGQITSNSESAATPVNVGTVSGSPVPAGQLAIFNSNLPPLP